MESKTCTKCGVEKPLTEYNKKGYKNNPDHLRTDCKDCEKQWQAQWRKSNPEYQLEWRKNNPGYQKERIQSNPEYWKEWHRKNPEYWKEWLRRNPGKNTMYKRQYRNRKKQAVGEYTPFQFNQKLEQQCNQCAYCGIDIIGKAQTDHIHPLSKGGSNNISNIVGCCQSCNSSKRDKTLPEWLSFLEATNRLTPDIKTNIENVYSAWLYFYSSAI